MRLIRRRPVLQAQYALRSTLRWPLRALSRWVIEDRFTQETSVICGVLVDYGGVPEHMRAEALGKVESAIRFVSRVDGRRIRSLVRDGTRILLATPLGPTGYAPTPNVILLEATDVEPKPLWQVATWIVHEAAHARMRSVIATSRNIARIERRCVEEEIAFVRRWPELDLEWFERYAAWNRAHLERPWWSYGRKLRRYIRALAETDADTWYGRLLKRLS